MYHVLGHYEEHYVYPVRISNPSGYAGTTTVIFREAVRTLRAYPLSHSILVFINTASTGLLRYRLYTATVCGIGRR